MLIICNAPRYFTFPYKKIEIVNKLEQLLKKELEQNDCGIGIKEYWFIIKILPADVIAESYTKTKNDFRFIKNRKKLVYSPILKDYDKVLKLSIKKATKLFSPIFWIAFSL